MRPYRHRDSVAPLVQSEHQVKEQPKWRYRFHLPADPTRTAATVPHQQSGTQKGRD